MPPPRFGPTADVAPPSFLQEEEEEEEPEEEIRVVEKVVEITDDGSIDESEVGRVNLAPYFAVAATIALALIFGYVAGGQIDRAVRANRAIDGALDIHNAVIQEQETTRGLKSRVSGAIRKAMDPTDPGADFELLAHLNEIHKNQPFPASLWSGQFYQAFRNAAPLMFEYYRSVQLLWDEIDEMVDRYEQPSVQASLKTWPQKRTELLKLVGSDTSGYAVTFREKGGKVLAAFERFENAERQTDGAVTLTKAKVTPLGGGEERILAEYPPNWEDPLSENPDEWFIRVNPITILGPKQQVVNHAGPLAAKSQEAYRQYLSDLNELNKNIQTVQANQESLIQALAEIRGARRPITFGF